MQLMSVRGFAVKHDVFSEHCIRHLIRTNRDGLSQCGAVLRIGRRLIVDEEKFLAWVREHGHQGGGQA